MKNYLNAILGKKNEYSLESMFIIITSFTGIILSFLSALFNFMLRFDIITIISSILMGIFSYIIYYLTKHLNKSKLSAVLSIIVLTCIIYPLIWIYNGGSFGGIPYFLLYNAVITAVFFNDRNYKYILTFQLSVILGLFYLEYLHPEYITSYTNDYSAYLDKGFSFSLVFLFIFFTIKNVMKTYNKKIKELKKAYNKMEIMATTDSLTGLFNRRKMYEVLEKEKKNFEIANQEFTIVLADIDYFKTFNDKYGHECGDSMLIQISNFLKSTLKSPNTICRWGGEEFLFLLPKTNNARARNIMEDIRIKISNKKFIYKEKSLSITFTSGICTYNKITNIDECIAIADEALYKGKKNGRNCIVTYEDNCKHDDTPKDLKQA